jgi:nitrile hydratase accessory protein
LSKPQTAIIRPRERKDKGPVFDEPWQAHVLAIVDALCAAGTFTATDWSKLLGEELRHAEESAAPDNAATYYEASLRALERLLISVGIATPETIADRRDAWVRAYLATPHGQPVNL